MNKRILLWSFLCALSASAVQLNAQNFDKRWLSGMFYGEGANFGDFNKDGKLDVVSGPYIHEGPEFTVKREFGCAAGPLPGVYGLPCQSNAGVPCSMPSHHG